ncbi:conserved hypothetical protein [Shewanella halifaxensis HAW-EB4]|uniref:Peptidase M60 domain-containing protein n=1 Tax=Shewanella halifaxensis (strain HAW-EB4) TaxID=458817 RepID=B0TT98_SHEHH|nr:SslE/AcfD family lipoprotein zinc metalloprotease [Shewanella halifaxensis]ABZ78039.1 conserved hypothetical protein [Shewanella halifaxensis HAW-EB4]
MKKTILTLTLLILIGGCGDDEPVAPSIPLIPLEPSTPVVPSIPLEPSTPIKLEISVSLDGTLLLGEPIRCNDQKPNGFEIEIGDTVSCLYNNMPLLTFSDVRADIARAAAPTERKQLLLIDADEFIEHPENASNAQTLIKTMGVVRGGQIDIELSTLQALQFENNYLNNLSMAEEDFKNLLEQQANDAQADKLPSTHLPDIKPEVSTGTSTDLNAHFVAADAEAAYQYKPEQNILSTAILTDSQGKPVAGITYFSRSSRGITDLDGSFQFSWGDSVSFGIDTFELGEVRGNQKSYTLSQLGEGNNGLNAEALVLRYATSQGQAWQLPARVAEVFARYPNVINEIISLSLSSQEKVLDTGNGEQIIAAKFSKQFELGLARDIDSVLCDINCQQTAKARELLPEVQSEGADIVRALNNVTDDSGQILADIQRLWGTTSDAGWNKVSAFHVFHDSTNFYGSTGNARGQATVNIANSAFPVMMARNDNNYWIPFGANKAWDKDTLAYITEAPSTVVPDKVSGETATFNLPFISIGEIGLGKIMVMGNARYNSVLVCPNGYSWNGGIDDKSQCRVASDSDDMKHFFQNSLKYLTNGKSGYSVGTNMPYVYFKRGGQVTGEQEPFIIDPVFGVTTEQVVSFAGIDPQTMPLLILNGFEYTINTSGSHYTLPMQADTTQPKLTQDDVTALIDYVNNGGNIMIMETLAGTNNTGALSRLLDSAGIAFGMGGSVVANGNGPSGGYADRVRNQRGDGIWIIERYAAVEGEDGTPTSPYIINQADGSVDWLYKQQSKPDDKPSLSVAKWVETDEDGVETTHTAFIDESQTDDLNAAKALILSAFTKSDGSPAYQECTNPNFHYEINCLEYRPGNNIPVTGGMFVPRYTQLELGDAQARAMVKAADLGTNIERLYQHELYFRSRAQQGVRLSNVDLNRTYQNMTVWLWNNLDYRYESGLDDELGFERFTQFLNCYSDNRAQGGTHCPVELQQQMLSLQMILGQESGEYKGYMNPSYPLNYMEKPLTRLMLGRSFWDLDIKVDPRLFPGEAMGSQGGGQVTFDLSHNTAAWFAGNRQPTGQWAVAQQSFTVSVNGSADPVTITVALADDLTGREKHELGLKRPPRMTQSFTLNSGDIGSSYSLTSPYGGLIYVQGQGSQEGHNVTLNFTGSVDAPLYQYDGKGGQWLNPLDSPAPIGEVISQSFVYTAAKANLNAANYNGSPEQFAKELDTFAEDMNNFYSRDEALQGNLNRKATDSSIPTNRHHFVNDIAISIGAAHSGYPVMNASFNAESHNLALTPLNSWLLWHEVGHNAAEAPFNVDGATEVVNNLLALYMQDKHLGKMSRVEQDIRIAPDFVASENGHAWAAGGAGERLVMFAQLKEWAETEFNIDNWYSEGVLPAYYDSATGLQGWNLFKLMHRLTRNIDDKQFVLKGDNLCHRQEGIGKSDQLLLCASYATQMDLSDFFRAWNPGSKAFIYPGDLTPQYEGGISAAGLAKVAALNLPKPTRDPLQIDRITVR